VIEGAWTAAEGRLVLGPGGRCEWNGTPGTWQVQPGVLVLSFGAAPLVFAWQRTGNQLGLTWMDGTRVVLVAEGSAPAAGAAPAPTGTRTLTDPTTGSALTVPASWSLIPGQNGNIRFARIIPGYGPTDIVQHEIMLFQTPVPPAELGLTMHERIQRFGADVDRLFGGLTRTGARVLDREHGPIARLDYDGQHAVGFAAGTLRASSFLLATVVSLPAVAGQLDEQVLAMLDSAVVRGLDPAIARQGIVGQWVVPAKGGTSLEIYTFHPDGSYVYHFESSHTGSVKNYLGDTTATWGTAAQDDDAGRWAIQGDCLVLTGRRGSESHLFRLWDEGGKRHLQIGTATFVR
jgi:hypothetical protein